MCIVYPEMHACRLLSTEPGFSVNIAILEMPEACFPKDVENL
jgi:hypothetical protein